MTSPLVAALASAVLAAAGSVAAAPPPHAPPAKVTKAACLDAVSKGQVWKDDHKLVEALAQFRMCARAECPAAVRGDCTTWAGEVEARLPTVVLSAKDSAGHDVIDFTVSLDDQPLAGPFGEAMSINPGPHTFRFERGDGSKATLQVLVKEGDKLKSVAAALVVPGAVPPADVATPAGSAPGSTARIVAYVLGGAGVVTSAVGIGVAFAAKAKDKTAAGETGTQRESDSASAVSQGNAASAVLGIGVAMAAAGVVVWLVAPSGKTAVGTNGREVLFTGTF
jgi:hypothetical protein